MVQFFSASAAAMAMVVVTLLVIASSLNVDAYAFGSRSLRSSRHTRFSPVINSDKRIHKRRDDGSSVTLYLFPSSPSVAAANNLHVSQRKTRRNNVRPETKLPAMSQSVLAPSDTLPGMSTAHGLLSPEVVMRIADQHDLDQDGALFRFLKTYKSRGPMACLPMLGDPNVLPELTRAMRDIA